VGLLARSISIRGDRGKAHQAPRFARGHSQLGPEEPAPASRAARQAARPGPGSDKPPGLRPDRSISRAAFDRRWFSPRLGPTGRTRMAGARPSGSPARPATTEEQQQETTGWWRKPRARAQGPDLEVWRSVFRCCVDSTPTHTPSRRAGFRNRPRADAAQGRRDL